MIISDAQADFWKGRSTVGHIFTLHAATEKHLLKKSKLHVAFMDFKKAYDTVNCNILWVVPNRFAGENVQDDKKHI